MQILGSPLKNFSLRISPVYFFFFSLWRSSFGKSDFAIWEARSQAKEEYDLVKTVLVSPFKQSLAGMISVLPRRLLLRGVVYSSSIFVRYNSSKLFREDSLVKNKNNFNDKLMATVDGRLPYGQLGLDYEDDKLRKIIETSNFGATKEKQSEKEDSVDASTTEQKDKDQVDQSQSASSFSSSNEDFLLKIIGNNDIGDSIHHQIPNLPSDKENKRSDLAKRLEKYLDSLQDTIFTATRALNDVTGYSSIEKLKKSIDDLENELKTARDQVKSCKELYSEAISRRSKLQKEVNELLTRKHNWSGEDLERFTNLYRNDHANEQAEVNAQVKLEESERKVDSIQLKLTQLILTRYHEEQIWSDKIRRASTWGTWIIMGLNMVLFIVATFLIEPWKRKRLVGSFEDKVKLALLETSEQQNWKIDEIMKENLERSKIVSGGEASKSESHGTGAKSWFFNLGGDNAQGDEKVALSTNLPAEALLDCTLSASDYEDGTFSAVKNKLLQYISKDIKYVQIDKFNLNVLFTSSVGAGVLLGYALTYLVR